MENKKVTGFDYLWCALYAFASVAFELLVVVVEGVLEWNARGPLLFVFQYIYYLAEGFLISLIIVFGQKACEKWFHNEKIPYGGIVLGLTWGLAHIFTKGSLAVGLLSAVGGFLFGAAYLLVNKDYRKALPIIILLFIL